MTGHQPPAGGTPAATAPTPASQFDRVLKILDEHRRHPARLIPILQAVQDAYSYLPEEVLHFIATALDIPAARVYGVATFYAHFALEPRGKYIVRLCDGTACHVKASIPILEALYQRLDLSEKKKTSPDLLFTVETVACLGACGLAPVMVVNEEVFGQMTPEKALAVVDNIIRREGVAP